MRQVISIHRDGSVSGLQRKPGQGIDLRKLGKADIERASEIIFEPDYQQWRVRILTGKLAGMPLGYAAIAASKADVKQYHYDAVELCGSFMYNDYDTAVKDEIAFLDAVRLSNSALLQ